MNKTSLNTTTEHSSPADADEALPGLEGPEQPQPSLVAQSLAAEWWERFTPRPATAFVGQRKIVQRLLEAGWTGEQVREALRRCDPPLVLGRVEALLRNTTARPNRAVTAPSAWAEGETYGG